MNFTFIDLAVVIIYLLAVVLIGMRFSSAKGSSRNFFFADKEIPWYLIMISIVATETSSLTFLSVPGMSYKGDFGFLEIAFGYIIGRTIVAYLILPLYSRGEYSSVYEWIGESFGKNTQRSVSSIFLLTRVLGDGVRLYVTSIPIGFILRGYLGENFSEDSVGLLTLLIITAATMLYTVFGGFKSVVVTDAFQFVIYIAGGIFAFWYLLNQPEMETGLSAAFSSAYLTGKLNVFHGLDGNFFRSPYFFITAITGGAFISIGSHGVDQMIAQRSLACRTEFEGRKALIGSGIIVFLQFILFLGIGILLYQFYNAAPISQDKVFSKFITEKIPSPVLGLIIAAILASAMSTLSSTINSLSLTIMVDWRAKSANAEKALKDSKLLSIFWGLVLFFSSLIPFYLSSKILEGLLELGLKISSFTFGPMIALFMLEIFGKKKIHKFVTPKSLIASLFLGVFTVIAVSYYFQPAFTLVIPMGILLFYAYLVVLRLLRYPR